MAPLISCQDISKDFGSRELFRGLSLSLFSGDRVGFIGPNGAGKSTLLKMLAGVERPDSGSVVWGKGVRVGYVPQHVEMFEGTIEEVVTKAAKGVYEDQEIYPHVRRVLGRLGFEDAEGLAENLSGGWRRRLTIAKELVKEPDVLLLDEPTNHLDLESILWLESFLVRENITFVVTSHDRVFLDAVCTKMWELSHSCPGGLFSVDGAYAEFMERRAAFLETQKRQERGLASKLRREEEWLRQTPKARTTKSRSRIQEAAKLQQEFSSIKRRNQEKKTSLGFSHSGRHTRKLISAKNLSKTLGGKLLFSGLDIDLQRGERLGIVGENGSGKSTLLKVLAKEMPSDTGTIKFAEGLNLFFFDQHRQQLDLALPLRRGLAPMNDTISYRGSSIHVISWAERFLFSKESLDLPMKQLSGGERARVVIARLMTTEADVLFLDEPTNDLDIDTLEVLEESLDDFPGAVVLVTHDRAMMDRVADTLIAVSTAEGKHSFNDTAAWLISRKKELKAQKSAPKAPVVKKVKPLSYLEQKELAGMEERIMKLEAHVETLSSQIDEASDMAKACDELAKAQAELEAAYHRWNELEIKPLTGGQDD